MTGVLQVSGPNNAGPGERQEMLERARAFLIGAGVAAEHVVRIDVPGRGGGEEGEGSMRAELEPLIPMLQSGSLFGEKQGVMLIEAQNLNPSEGALLGELLTQADDSAVAVSLVAFGSVPAALAKVVKAIGEVVMVRKMWERQAGEWLGEEVRQRDLAIDRDGSEALLRRFGTDIAALSQALDQLEEHRGKITKEMVLDRFRNRPDEPLVHYTDAVSTGNVGEALRRLADFLTHGHPLVLLATIESDVKRRAMASSAEDEETFRKVIGARSDDRRAQRIWRDRGRVSDSSLAKALDALVRADRVIKSQPEEVHRVTLERLTVALCRWYGRRR
ncbi:MAG: DNA polymerase III subunit delta [Acidimicrobiia bacterium]